MFGTYKYTFECLVKNDDDDDDAFFFLVVSLFVEFIIVFFLVVVLVVVLLLLFFFQSSSESDENLAGALICLLKEDGLRSFVDDIHVLSIIRERNSPKYSPPKNEEKRLNFLGERNAENHSRYLTSYNKPDILITFLFTKETNKNRRN